MKLGMIDVDSRKHVMCKVLDLGSKSKVTVNICSVFFSHVPNSLWAITLL